MAGDLVEDFRRTEGDEREIDALRADRDGTKQGFDLELTRAEKAIRAVEPTACLRFDESEDFGELTDDEATLIVDGEETGISLQLGYRYVIVNEWVDNRTAMHHHWEGVSVLAAGEFVAGLIRSRQPSTN